MIALIVDLETEWRGGQNQALLTAKGILACGHDAHLVAIRDSPLARRAVQAGIQVHEVAARAKRARAAVLLRKLLSQNKFGQYQHALKFSERFQIPLISLEHTLPMPNWGKGRRELMRSMRGAINVFISDFSKKEWGFNFGEVIHHGVDTKLFSPGTGPRKAQLLSVVNDWKNRDWCCGFKLWQQVSASLPVLVIGDTPGLSFPAKSPADLVNSYRSSRVFLNTSLVSPVPTALLEAMSCGCACVSTATCMIPEIIENGVNGFISNDPMELRGYAENLLRDPALAEKMGEAARATILSNFSLESFIIQWNRVFEQARGLVYTGEIP